MSIDISRLCEYAAINSLTHEEAVQLCDHIDAQAAEIERLRQPWQPIETAPKDGTLILLGRGQQEDCEAISAPGFWQEGWEDSIDDMGCDSGFVDVNFQQFNGGRSFGAEKHRTAPSQPTHWMPLPAPPAALSGETA